MNKSRQFRHNPQTGSRNNYPFHGQPFQEGHIQNAYPLSKLPAISSARLIKMLERAGAVRMDGSGGSHRKYSLRIGDAERTLLVSQHTFDIARSSLKGMLREAAISLEEFLDLYERYG